MIIKVMEMDGELTKGGIAMRVTSIQPIGYLKVHLAYDEITTKLLKPLASAGRKIDEFTEQASIIVGLILNLFLFITAFIKLAKVEAFTTSYYDALGRVLQSMIVLL
jgi:hypothetical protein